jgi:ABC-type lipoprotein release transport system permease subunit
MIWKTAWKNVWRNRVRSLVVISSITVGIFAGVFSVAFMNGMIAQRVDAAIDEEISHIQITGKDFRLNNDPAIIISPTGDVEGVIEGISGIEGYVERTIVTGMAATASKSTGVQINGIDPVREKKVFSLDKTIMKETGTFFEKESKYDLALIGHDLAKELGIIRYMIDTSVMRSLSDNKVPEITLQKLSPLSGLRFTNEKKFRSSVEKLLSAREIRKYGSLVYKEAWSYRENSRLTLTFLDKENNQVGAVFRIAGIYDLKNTMFEQAMVFIQDSVLKKLAGFDKNSCHQVIIRLNDIGQTTVLSDELETKLPDKEVMSWKELQPDLAMMTDYVHQIYGFFMGIILAALAFGIINTMLMVVLERTKELGMLTAIGMNKRRVFSMIMLESVFLSLIGGISGMIVGWLAVLLTARNGINFAQYAEGMEAFGYSAHVYPEISAGFFILVTILIIITGILSSVYPAFKALKLDPAEAIRTE